MGEGEGEGLIMVRIDCILLFDVKQGWCEIDCGTLGTRTGIL